MSSSEAGAAVPLSRRIRLEIADLDRIVKRVLDLWESESITSPPSRTVVEAAALNLHSFYSGIERLLELIIKQIDRATPTGQAWHRDVLEQATREMPGIRPAVLNPVRLPMLDEFRRFRHVVRHLYTTHLDASRMAPLLSLLPVLWHEMRADLLAFAQFLDDAGRRREAPPSEDRST